MFSKPEWVHRFWSPSIAFFHWDALCFASSNDITFLGCIITFDNKYVKKRPRKQNGVYVMNYKAEQHSSYSWSISMATIELGQPSNTHTFCFPYSKMVHAILKLYYKIIKGWESLLCKSWNLRDWSLECLNHLDYQTILYFPLQLILKGQHRSASVCW